jgi:hypothetical protein
MRQLSAYVIALCALAVSVFAQTSTDRQTLAPTKDAASTSLIADSLSRMRSAELDVSTLSSTASGTLIMNGTEMPLSYKTKGTDKVRVEVQQPKGTSVYVLNGGIGQIRRTDGGIRHLLMNNTIAQRVSYIPALSLLAEYAKENISVDKPSYAVADDGRQRPTVAVSFAPASENEGDTASFAEMTRTQFTFDPDTGFVSQMEFTRTAENNVTAKEKVRIVFSDYKQINGIAVPFTQTTYASDRIESELQLKEVSFGSGMDDSEFAFFEEVRDAKSK